MDIGLSNEGVKECLRAARQLKNIKFDIAFTSKLLRAIHSLEIILMELTGKIDIPIIKTEALNERHYGILQGMNKDKARANFGAEQIEIWRRSFKEGPPGGESLQDTYKRAVPFFIRHIIPNVRRNNNTIVVAHGNSIRAIIKYLDKIDDYSIAKIEVPTAQPIVYQYRNNTLYKTKLPV